MKKNDAAETSTLSRRQVLSTGVIGVAATGLACSVNSRLMSNASNRAPAIENVSDHQQRASNRMPVVYLPHGGGPWPFVDLGFPAAELASLGAYLRSIAALTVTTPRALLIISAHWEAALPTVMSNSRPPMLYDYYGFPDAAYTVTWPAAGHPELATRVRELLHNAGIQSAEDAARGFDHGVFVPGKVAYPEATIPTLQLSLQTGLDPAAHIAVGRALAPLRDEGVFILGSGMSYHNMRGFFDQNGAADAREFDAWLRDAVAQPQATRDQLLRNWSAAPSARACHPREEHLLPLMVVAGAAGSDFGTTAFAGFMANKNISAFHFGA